VSGAGILFFFHCELFISGFFLFYWSRKQCWMSLFSCCSSKVWASAVLNGRIFCLVDYATGSRFLEGFDSQ